MLGVRSFNLIKFHFILGIFCVWLGLKYTRIIARLLIITSNGVHLGTTIFYVLYVRKLL